MWSVLLTVLIVVGVFLGPRLWRRHGAKRGGWWVFVGAVALLFGGLGLLVALQH